MKVSLYILCTLAAYIAGLLLDANLGVKPFGFLYLRILLPLLTTGIWILKAVQGSKKE